MNTSQSKPLVFSLLALSPLVLSPSAHAIELKAKGFIKAGAVGSNRAVNSFAQENLVAPTASHPKEGNFTVRDGHVTSFQTAQTRLGLEAIVDPKSRGYVEFDFVDFTKSSPTVAMVPRVRIAKVEYDVSDHRRIIVGQDWDTFAPLNTATYNYVGNHFQAGNSGFMRPQAIFVDRHGELELRYALGMNAANVAATTTESEKSDFPTATLAVAYGTSPNRVGVSFIGSRLKLTDTTPKGFTTRGVYGASVFAEKTGTSGFLRSEFYASQNLENTGALTLSRGRAQASVQDFGGFISGKYLPDDVWGIFATAGFAKVRDESNVSDGSTLAASGVNQRRSFNADTLGITSNVVFKLGVDHKLTEKLTWFTEVSRYQTNFRTYGNAASHVIDAGFNLAI